MKALVGKLIPEINNEKFWNTKETFNNKTVVFETLVIWLILWNV